MDADTSAEQAVPQEVVDRLPLQDLTSHPLAGTEVEFQITVQDSPNQTARSKTVTVKLPERSFRSPVAPALADMRRTLALDSRKAPEVLDDMYELIKEHQDGMMDEQALDDLKGLYQSLTAVEGEQAQEEAQSLKK